MSTTTAYIHATADELRPDVRVHEYGDPSLYSVISWGAGAIHFGNDRPEDVASRLRWLADEIVAETARLRAEAAGQTTLEVA